MQYHVHNMSRAQTTRQVRTKSPTHRGMVQFIAGQRLIRGRPLVIDEETLLKNLEMFKERTASGYVEVRTPDGRKIDLGTMTAAPAPAVPPLPKPVPDSMNNDLPAGIPLPIYPDGALQSDYEKPAEPVSVEQVVQLVEEEAPVEMPKEAAPVEEPLVDTVPETVAEVPAEPAVSAPTAPVQYQGKRNKGKYNR